MKKLILIILLLLLTSCSKHIDTQDFFASEERAEEYHFTHIIYKKDSFWEISNGKRTVQITENSENQSNLSEFREVVGDIKNARFKLILYGCQFLAIIGLGIYILYRKPRNRERAIILTATAIFAIYAMKNGVQAYMERQNEIENANIIFLDLSKEE